MKILLIEDSLFLRAAIGRSLVKAGDEVTGMAEGRKALLAVRKHRFSGHSPGHNAPKFRRYVRGGNDSRRDLRIAGRPDFSR
jgi:CheY-like chemotaxis protein